MGTVTLAMVHIGVDIGQKRDPTAIAVCEVTSDGDGEEVYTTRYLQRLPLGTPYPKVAERIAEIVENTRRRIWEDEIKQGVYQSSPVVDAQVFVDATGVGKPVVDVLRETGLEIVECYFTHGDRRTKEQGRVTVGKAWLVSRLQALLQTSRLVLPNGSPEASALMQELLDYEIRVDQNANDKYGAFKVGSHDDLVTAVGLACQEESNMSLWLSQLELDRYIANMQGAWP